MRNNFFVSLLFLLSGWSFAQSPVVQAPENTVDVQPISVVSNSVDVRLHQLKQSEFVVGDFTQKRQLQGFSRPLVSSGVFVYWQEYGVYWGMQKPFKSAVTYGHAETIHWSATGVAEKIEKNDAVQKQASGVVLAVLGADISSLSEQFDMESKETDLGWSLVLLPKQQVVADIIAKLDVSGSDYVNHIVVYSVNGDTTTIDFTNISENTSLKETYCSFYSAANDGDSRDSVSNHRENNRTQACEKAKLGAVVAP